MAAKIGVDTAENESSNVSRKWWVQNGGSKIAVTRVIPGARRLQKVVRGTKFKSMIKEGKKKAAPTPRFAKPTKSSIAKTAGAKSSGT